QPMQAIPIASLSKLNYTAADCDIATTFVFQVVDRFDVASEEQYVMNITVFCRVGMMVERKYCNFPSSYPATTTPSQSSTFSPSVTCSVTPTPSGTPTPTATLSALVTHSKTPTAIITNT